MGRKRPAPPPPPPPPPPPQESSSDESEDESEEEEVAPTPTPTPASDKSSKNPPPAAPEEDETEDEESSGSEPDDPPPPVRPRPAAHTAPKPSPPSNPKPSSNTVEDGGGSSEYESEELEPPQKPESSNGPALALSAQKPKTEAETDKKKKKGPEQSPSTEGKKSGRVMRTWTADDEIKILEALAAHKEKHGAILKTDELLAALAGRLDKEDCSYTDMYEKVRRLKSRYENAAKKAASTGDLPKGDDKLRMHKLSQIIWEGAPRKATDVQNGAKNPRTKEEGGHAGPSTIRELRAFDEVQSLYPYLAEKLVELKTPYASPANLKRALEKMDDDKAHALETKIKKFRAAAMKMQVRELDIEKELLNTVIGLID